MQRAAAQLNFDTNKLRTLIADYVGIEAELVTDEAHFSDDLGLDWLDQLELMVLIEDKFMGIDFFANTTAAQINVVGDLIWYIEHHSAVLARRSAA
jgi:acyl carrier protein